MITLNLNVSMSCLKLKTTHLTISQFSNSTCRNNTVNCFGWFVTYCVAGDSISVSCSEKNFRSPDWMMTADICKRNNISWKAKRRNVHMGQHMYVENPPASWIRREYTHFERECLSVRKCSLLCGLKQGNSSCKDSFQVCGKKYVTNLCLKKITHFFNEQLKWGVTHYRVLTRAVQNLLHFTEVW